MTAPDPASEVADQIKVLDIQRVVHFTPGKSLHHIISDGQITPSKQLKEIAPDYFDPTDTERWDRHPNMTCVTFNYPNPFYFDTARKKIRFRSFEDWVCLMIRPEVLLRDGVLFSPVNAATGGGVHLRPGAEGLARCYASTTPKGRIRGVQHNPYASTDLQAEALVPGPIPLSDLITIVTKSASSASNARAALLAGDLDPDQFNWAVSEKMFQKEGLSNALQYNRPIVEAAWTPEGESEDQ